MDWGRCGFGFGFGLPALASCAPRAETGARCGRSRPGVRAQSDINGGDALRKREEDVADKIAKLKKLKKSGVKYSQAVSKIGTPQEDRENGASEKSESSLLGDASEPFSLESQMDEAEKFFGVNSDTKTKPDTGSNANHVPKVQTWGVFPRPENISRAYGGGRKIERGGEVESPEKQAAREAKTRALLGSYRAGMGVDMEREEQFRDAVEVALETTHREMKRGRPLRALEALSPLQDEVSPNSALGGELWINLGLVLEAVGRDAEAKKVYAACRKSPIPLVSSRAKELSYGFDAMETLQMEAPARGGLRTIQFDLGDVASYTNRRYDTTFYEKKNKKALAPRDRSSDAVPLAIIAASLLAFIVWRLNLLP